MNLEAYIRNIPDFPKPGILFKDITPLLKSSSAFRYVIKEFGDYYHDKPIDIVCGIEARGFIFAAPLALELDKPFVPIRKEGKLPFKTQATKYKLEYGDAAVEIHTDAVKPGQRVLIVDDVLATGGTLATSGELIESQGGEVAGFAILIELLGLNGRSKLGNHDLMSLIQYP